MGITFDIGYNMNMKNISIPFQYCDFLSIN